MRVLINTPIEAETATGKHVVAVVSPLVVGAGAPGWWEPLFKTCRNPSVFLSPAWMESWLEVYGLEFEGSWVRWESSGIVVGGCLFVTRRVWKWAVPMKTIFLNATGESVHRTPMAEYNDILHLAGYEAAIATDAVRVLRAQRWSLLSIVGYEKNALVTRLVSGLPAAAIETDERKANFVDLAALVNIEFETSLAGKAGNHIRRNRRLYETAYGNFEVVRARDLEEAMRFFADLVGLHTTRWGKKGKGGSFSSEAVVDFHRRLIGRLWPVGGVDLVSVRAAGKVVGYLYNFTTENKVYFFQSGFSYEHGSKRSPGLLTHALCIEDYRLKGYSEYDLLAGEAQYKRALARNERSLYWTVIYRDVSWPRIVLSAVKLKGKVENLLRRAAALFA